MRCALAVVLTSAVLLPATESRAAFLITGSNSYSSVTGSGWVSFAAYANPAGRSWIDDLSISGLPSTANGFGSFSGFERAVIFYEIVPTSGTVAISSIKIDTIDPAEDAGRLSNRVFNETSGGAVVSSNPNLNSPLAAAFQINAAMGGNTKNENSAAFGDPVQFNWQTNGGNALVFGRQSGLFALTFESDPLNIVFTPATIAFESGTPATVLVPVANPEPGSLLLMSAGMATGAWWHRRRKQQAA